MLELRPSCECCDHALPNDALAWICAFECTFCAACACGHLAQACPNCGGGLVPRPVRPHEALAKHPAGTRRVHAGRPCPGPALPALGVITAPRVALRAFEEGDLEALMGYRNDPEVARYQSWTGMDAERAAAFWRAQRTRRFGEPGGWCQLTAVLRASGAIVGDVALHVESADPRQARIGYTFDRAYQGRGLATEAVGALVAHAFTALGLHRVAAYTDARNAASIALLTRLGFVREGQHVAAAWFKGEWTDDVVFAKRAPVSP